MTEKKIDVSVAGFVGNESEIASALAPIIEEAVADDTEKPKEKKPNPGLENSVVVEPEEVDRMFKEKVGAFAPNLRVACPLKNFARRRSEMCMDCPHFVGLGTKLVIAEIDEKDPAQAMLKFTIWCDHPLSRSLHYYPED